MNAGAEDDAGLEVPTSHAAGESQKGRSGSRQRNIISCLTCRRRKVRCDHQYPICSACQRGSHTCTYATAPNEGNDGSSRVSKTFSGGQRSSQTALNARLDRLEALLEQAFVGPGIPTAHPAPQLPNTAGGETSLSAAYNSHPTHQSSASADGRMLAGGSDGTLLLGEGQSHFVSSLHWALMADEVGICSQES